MSFKKLELKKSYNSLEKEGIASAVNLLLNEAVFYKRSVGFFSSSALDFINSGIHALVKNNGKIKLITSPKLSQEDFEAINLGYKNKENVIKNSFYNEFSLSINNLETDNLKEIAKLIYEGILEIKIVTTNDLGMYHDKVSIFEDKDGFKICMTGSNNETGNGYGHNYEKVRVYTVWDDLERVIEEESDFDLIWDDQNPTLETYNFDNAVKNHIIEIIHNEITNKEKEKSVKSEKYTLRDYQKEAINSWKANNYNGFFVMATGTGKTVTTIYGLKELLDKESILTVIAVPYKHLISQWCDDVEDIIPEAKIIKVSSEFGDWDTSLRLAILYNRYNKDNKQKIIIISTIESFYSDRFNNSIKQNAEKRLLIVDEAHNFLNKIYSKKFDINYEYKLGLSATPVFGFDESKTKDLCDFFGGIVYKLPIEKAIGKYLVNYNYEPIFINTTEKDEIEFAKARKKMLSCINPKTHKIDDKDRYIQAYRAKLRCISMAENKLIKLSEFIDKINTEDHFIVYCSDGKIGDKKHLNAVVDLLNEKGLKPSQFTCEENINQRISLIDNFNKGYISTLVAIRCLDEGINIPSIKTALILSSNDNYREFVQRRGRILRKYKFRDYKKDKANIIDVVVLPSENCKEIAKIELRRYYEYAKLAINSDSLLNKLNMLLENYNLTLEDIQFDNEFINESEDNNDE